MNGSEITENQTDMKKIALFLALLLAFPFAGQAQPRVSDKELVSVIWAM